MSDPWTTAERWLAHCAGGGSLLLLLSWVLLCLTRQPARKQRLGEWGLLAALLLAVLSLGPAWLYLPLPVRSSPSTSVDPDPAYAVAPPVLDLEDTLRWFEEEIDHAVAEEPHTGYAVVQPFPEHGEPVRFDESISPFSPSQATLTKDDSRSLTAWFVIAYALGALVLLSRWLLGYLALWRLLRAANAAPSGVAGLFAELTADMPRKPRLLVSRRLHVPVSCGLVRPTVVLPVGLCDPTQVETLRWVFAHELTHLRRRDAWAGLLFGLGQAVYFYVPWFWWLRRQVRLCQEYVADAAAAEQANRAEDYAQFLLSLTRAPTGPVAATGVRGNSSDLFRRMTMLLQTPIRLEKHCPRRWSLTAAGGLLALAVLVAGIGTSADTTARAADEAPLPVVAQQPPTPPRPPVPPLPPGVPGVPGVEVDYLLRTAPHGNIDVEKFRKELQSILQQLRAGEQAKALEMLQKQIDQLPAGPEEMKRRIVDLQRTLVERLAERGRPSEVRLGVGVEKPSPALIEQLDLPRGQGLVLTQVLPDSAAAKAGLKVNDVLLEVNGIPVPEDVQEFVKQLGAIKGNTPVDIVVVRKGKRETIKGLTLPGLKPAEDPRVHVRIRSLPGQNAPVGVPLPVFGPQGGVMTTIYRTDNRYTTRHQEGSLIITVTGSVDGGKAKVNEVHVQDGQVANKYESLNQVPDQYRDKVKNLVEMSEKSSIRIEIKTL